MSLQDLIANFRYKSTANLQFQIRLLQSYFSRNQNPTKDPTKTPNHYRNQYKRKP